MDPIAQALRRNKLAVGRLITVFEDTRPAAAEQRRNILAKLSTSTQARRARFVGVTGAPGAGKSTLIGQLALRLVAADPTLSVAVLAVDPSSQVSGGALLGDRTRVQFPPDELRLFFRSQATGGELGGVGRASFQVCRLLYHLFDLVVIETVGTGQSEIEIQQLADWVYLVLQPLAGDEVQFMKAGIMEIPNAFIVNKCDQQHAANRSTNALRARVRLASTDNHEPVIHQASARTGTGLDEIAAELLTLPPAQPLAHKERYFFDKWVRDEYGRAGAALLANRDPLAEAGDFDAAQAAVRATLER